ncbi:MAG TPA: MgtC/SapB family protein [Oscillospiraceae bacterium]|nr:MgtC/SapB family protein [Oscillospiraceae bacterium]HPS75710.1 MgtC/SapB family protein [Oscillospiraceae bacterium]
MLHVFDFMREMTTLSVVLRMLLAFLCGGVIGLEREYKHRPAGFRTHILICLGAAMTTLTSQYLYLTMQMYTDVARLGAQVIAGIGFIGAGTIVVTRQRRVKGLTTAAGMWTSAIIGLACGAGYVECAIFATLLVMAAEMLLIRLEYRVASGAREMNIYVEYTEADRMTEILQGLRAEKVRITNLEISRRVEGDRRYSAVVSLGNLRGIPAERLLSRLEAMDDVLLVEEM